MISDCYCFVAYDAKAPAEWLKQKCFAHFLKELAKLEREKKRGAVRFPQELWRCCRRRLS